MAAFDIFFSEPAVVTGGGIRHEPGTVHAYFRNGKFTNIVKAGGFAIPIVRRTLVGHIELIQISTASHEVEVRVTDVTTADSLVHPSVTVRLLVRLDDRDNYKKVARVLTAQGKQIGTFLSAGLGKLIDGQVRSAMAGLTSDEIVRAHLPNLVPLELSTLADGAVVIQDVVAVDWHQSPYYLEVLDKTAKATTLDITHQLNTIEQGYRHELEHSDTVHQVELERMRADAQDITAQREHARQLEIARLDAFKEISATYFASGRGNNKDYKEVLGAFTGPPTGPAAQVGWTAPAAPLAGPAGFLDAAAYTAETPPIANDLPTLHVDARLKRHWIKAGYPDVVAGCACAHVGSRIGAVFVLADAAGPAFRPDDLRPLERALMDSYHVDTVRLILLPLLGTRRTLVENYLAEATRHVASVLGEAIVGAFDLGIDLDDVSLRVEVSGPRAADVKRTLTDLDACLLSPLSSLLALEYVEAVLSG